DPGTGGAVPLVHHPRTVAAAGNSGRLSRHGCLAGVSEVAPAPARAGRAGGRADRRGDGGGAGLPVAPPRGDAGGGRPPHGPAPARRTGVPPRRSRWPSGRLGHPVPTAALRAPPRLCRTAQSPAGESAHYRTRAPAFGGSGAAAAAKA